MTKSQKKVDLPSLYEDRLNLVKSRLTRYLEKPNEKAIHEVRTSIRRLETVYSVLPKSSKTSESKQFQQACKEFFRLNSKSRDCDVIAEKLSAHDLKQCGELIQNLRKTRHKSLLKASKKAKALNRLPMPRLAKTSAESNKKLVSRITKLAAVLQTKLPMVSEDPDDGEQLHEMRKDVKRLFYLLELDEEIASLRQMIMIKLFQRLTGDIHDCDITLEYLSQFQNDNGDISKIVHAEENHRDSLTKELIELIEREPWEKLNSIV